MGAWLWFFLAALARPGFAQDEAVEARIGEVDPHRPVDADVLLYPAPTLDAVVSSYRISNKFSFFLEGNVEEKQPLKWLGWWMPEKKSVLLAGPEGDAGPRRLLIGGKEEKSFGEIWDAELLDEGRVLVLVTRGKEGMLYRRGESALGPFDRIDLLGRVGIKEVAYATVRGGEKTLHVGDRSFPVEEPAVQVHASADGRRIAWIEQGADKKQRAVVEGKRGLLCDFVIAGIHFSPNGRHAAYVTREGTRYRGWIDGEEIKSDLSVVTARALDDGGSVYVETWNEAVKLAPGDAGAPPVAARGRIVVRGKREERVLQKPIQSLEFQGERLYGIMRTEEKSLLAWIEPTGEVTYEEIQGRVVRLQVASKGNGRILSVQTPKGLFVEAEGKRVGPYERVSDLFHLEHTGRFGYVAVKGNKVLLGVGGKLTPLALTEPAPPVRISKTEMTAAIVGVQTLRAKKEIWVRVVPLE